MKQKLKKVWPWLGMLSGIVGIGVLLKMIDVNAVVAALAGANPILLAFAALLVLLTVAIRARRWKFLFQRRRVDVPFRHLLSILLIDSFYGQFLPASSAVGATMLFAEGARCGANTVDTVATILAERVFNMVAIFVAASLVLIVAQPIGLPSAFTVTIVLASIGLVTALLSLQRGWGISWINRMLARVRLQKLGEHLATLSKTLQSDFGQPRVVGHALALSVLVNVSMMVASYLVTVAVAGPVPLLGFLAMAAIIVAIQGVPITPGSLGVREGLYVFFLGLLGISEPQALTVGLIVMLLYWFQGLFGGLVLLRRSLPKAKAKRLFGRIRTALSPGSARMSPVPGRMSPVPGRMYGTFDERAI